MIYTRLLLISLFLLFFSLINEVKGQQFFERRAVEVSNLGISYTNVGTIGRPNVRNQPVGLPSMEYPRGTGTEHLFEAGIWLGARVQGQVFVSTSSVTHPSGYNLNSAGFEFTNDGTPFLERSSLLDSPNYSPQAISHQDLIAVFSDSRITRDSGLPVPGHENPLFADVRLESYNWNFGFADGISIVRYDITNNGEFTWEDFYFSIYSDMVVRNVLSTTETGSNFFNKGGMYWIPEYYGMYVFDRGSFDQPRFNTYGGLTIMGAEFEGIEYHPRRADELDALGLTVPTVSPDFWLFGVGAGDFIRPTNDLDRYNRMVNIWPLEQHKERLRNDGVIGAGNFIQLNTIGPLPDVEPGRTISVYVAFVAALMPEDFQSKVPGQEQNVDDYDNEESRVNLIQNFDWAYRLFDGQVDTLTGVRTRFLVPEPPEVPRMRVELDAGIASIYWDNRAEFSIDPVTGDEDFAGYRLYRSRLGADLTGIINVNPQMLREWDLPESGVGFGTGFDEIRLDTPVTFPGDPVEYHYRFDITGMLSGWQYLVAVTAFDEGDDRTDPLETSVNANAVRIFPGTAPNPNFGSGDYKVGVYPNPYRVNAAWDRGTSFTRKIMFYNLPKRAQIRIYTLAGEIVATLDHDADTYSGDIRWFSTDDTERRIFSGGEHAWDLLSEANQNLATGLYLFTVKDLDGGGIQRGRFAVIK